MGIFLLWATWAHEYMVIFVKIDRHRTSGVLKELSKQHVSEMSVRCQ